MDRLLVPKRLRASAPSKESCGLISFMPLVCVCPMGAVGGLAISTIGSRRAVEEDWCLPALVSAGQNHPKMCTGTFL